MITYPQEYTRSFCKLSEQETIFVTRVTDPDVLVCCSCSYIKGRDKIKLEV